MTFVLVTVAPVFGVILLGLLAAKLSYLPEGAHRPIIEFVFRLAIPALLFRMMVEAQPPAASPFALWGAFFGTIAILWIVSTLITLLVLRSPPEDTASLALATCFGNLLLLGLPMALNALGPEVATPMAIIFLLELPVMWFAAVLHLTIARRAERRGAAGPEGVRSIAGTAMKLGYDLLKNPIILALFAGALWRETGLGLHPILKRMLDLLSQAATPGSLVALGLSLATFRMSGQTATVAVIVALKLLLMPVVAWQLAFHVFDLPPLWAALVVLFASMPTGAVAYVFASENQKAVEPVAAIIAVGVAISIVTISACLYALGPDLVHGGR